MRDGVLSFRASSQRTSQKMSQSLEVTVLGSGTSMGVPTLGCHCAVCESKDVHDKRTRPSVLLSYGGRNVVIDTTPDFRSQAMAVHLDRLDAILYTHAHADHIFGLDDIMIRVGVGVENFVEAVEVHRHGQFSTPTPTRIIFSVSTIFVPII